MALHPADLPEQDARRKAFAELKGRLQGDRNSMRIALESLVPSAIPLLDRLLGGGFPQGALVTLEGGVSSGRWSIVARLLAQITRRGLAAVIDRGELYPPDLAQAGVRLERTIVVPTSNPLGIARAADILLRSRACRIVVMPAVQLRAAVWTRLSNLAHRAGILLIVVATQAAGELAAAAGMRLHCRLERAIIHGARGVWCTLAGYALRTELRKHKQLFSGACAQVRVLVGIENSLLRECHFVKERLHAVVC